ncbi:putative porin [Christiangramia gaetbulicola]|uniref:Putative porin n=1 Tax=Christiangramia gaetbulicola TaxID=703340 RepID=A0A2T6ACD7_9FLAO|nr:porin [Christiangramia gaetbulicola]PTX41456.1 putative porin [Christiangramia gaetbulicola]
MKIIFTVLLSILFQMAFSQNSDSLKVELAPYTSLRGHFGVYNEEIEVQENASRLGFEVSVSKNDIRYFAVVELGISLFKSNQQFNTDANTNSGFLAIDNSQENQVFGNRLGFLGADFGKYGIISVGKQWSVYYDITGYTDKFNVFGGKGSATYVANSDGGETGTGRASQSLIYRNSFGNLKIGGQLQFRTTLNDHLFDGYGFSAQYELLKGLKLGGAYNRTLLADLVIDNFLGMDDHPEYYTFGLNFNNETWDIGLVYANQTNGDLSEIVVEDELIAEVYDADGFEAFVKFMKPKYAFLLGYNQYDPDLNDLPLQGEFNTRDIVFGAEFKPTKRAYLYGEYRIAAGDSRLELRETDVFTLGIRIDLSNTYSKNF